MCCVEASGEERSGGRGEDDDQDDADDAAKTGEGGTALFLSGGGTALLPMEGGATLLPRGGGIALPRTWERPVVRTQILINTAAFPHNGGSDVPPLPGGSDGPPSLRGRAILPQLLLGGVVGVVPVAVLAPAAAPLLPALLHTAHSYFLRLLPSSNDLSDNP